MALIMRRRCWPWLLVVLAAGVATAQEPGWTAKAQQAKEAMSGGHFEVAAARYRELTQAFPDNPGLAMNLGLALHSASRYEEAVQQFQKALRMQPKVAGGWFLLGVDYQRLNRPADAIPALRRALELEPQNEAARLELGDALFQAAQYSEALREFRAITVTSPRNSKAWLGVGLSYSSLAGQAFQSLQRSYADSAFVQILIAQSLADQHQYRSAYQRYRRALQLDPGLIEAHRAIASIYRITEHPDWAVEEEAGIREPERSVCGDASLACLFSQKKHRDLVTAAEGKKTAEALYWSARSYQELALEAQEMLAQLPPSAELHQLLAVMYDLRELYLDAAREWREAIVFQPGNRIFRKKLAWSLSGAGEWDAVVEVVKELQKDDAANPELAFLLGDSLLKLQHPEEAAPQLEKVVVRELSNLRAQASLGTAYFLTGRFTEAILHLEPALPIDRDGKVTYQLAQAYRSTGDSRKAGELMKKYAELQKASADAKAGLNQGNEITAPR